jgi:hypothetical protein
MSDPRRPESPDIRLRNLRFRDGEPVPAAEDQAAA